MHSRFYIGNDWVDLTSPRWQGKGNDERFLDRICHADERDWVRDTQDETERDFRVALIWSAKEAAMKVLKKLHPEEPLVFHALRLRVHPGATPGAALMGEVTLPQEPAPLPVHWERHPTGILAVCTFAETGLCVEVRSRVSRLNPPEERRALEAIPLSPAELDSCRAPLSAPARQLSKRLAQEWGLGEILVLRRRLSEYDWSPPFLVDARGSALEDIDLSLSHDGDTVAASFAARNGFPRSPGLRLSPEAAPGAESGLAQ